MLEDTGDELPNRFLSHLLNEGVGNQVGALKHTGGCWISEPVGVSPFHRYLAYVWNVITHFQPSEVG